MSGTGPILDVSDLWVGFPNYGSATVHALCGINLQVASGEIVGLVGESGSGKTTLARAVMGLVPEPGVIERGQVLFGGRNLASLDDTARRAVLGRELVMVIPNPRAELNPVLTVGRQISNVVLHHLGVGRREADRVALAMLRALGQDFRREKLGDTEELEFDGIKSRSRGSVHKSQRPVEVLGMIA